MYLRDVKMFVREVIFYSLHMHTDFSISFISQVSIYDNLNLSLTNESHRIHLLHIPYILESNPHPVFAAL
jgi:hypothetical protein